MKIKPVKESSLLFSWEWCREDFREQWAYLTGGGPSAENKGETIWQTRFKDVQLLSVPDGDTSYRIAFKCYREKRFFRYFCRPSLAAREAMGFEVVKSLGIPAAEVLAYGEKRRFFNLEESWFITRFIEGTDTLAYFKDHPEEHETLMVLLKESIRYLAMLHKANYIHSGAHPRNILWKRDDEGRAETVWIDLATLRDVSRSRKYWKYILTDLSDLTEYFKLTQEELDTLMSEYRQIHDIPVAYRCRTDHTHKSSEAYRLK